MFDVLCASVILKLQKVYQENKQRGGRFENDAIEGVGSCFGGKQRIA